MLTRLGIQITEYPYKNLNNFFAILHSNYHISRKKLILSISNMNFHFSRKWLVSRSAHEYYFYVKYDTFYMLHLYINNYIRYANI